MITIFEDEATVLKVNDVVGHEGLNPEFVWQAPKSARVTSANRIANNGGLLINAWSGETLGYVIGWYRANGTPQPKLVVYRKTEENALTFNNQFMPPPQYMQSQVISWATIGVDDMDKIWGSNKKKLVMNPHFSKPLPLP